MQKKFILTVEDVLAANGMDEKEQFYYLVGKITGETKDKIAKLPAKELAKLTELLNAEMT